MFDLRLNTIFWNKAIKRKTCIRLMCNFRVQSWTCGFPYAIPYTLYYLIHFKKQKCFKTPLPVEA